ncbi:S-type pyocin domain-containing protein [Pseudomonas sp. NPDC089743]|uniref:S-type pyocin domain-containing protein n=1 Tax=Pseudomonas sp. NPDC089743 TaxID=3364471 RepID=UPI0037F6DB88
MAQDDTIKFGEPFRDSRNALNLNEGLWMNEEAPDRAPLPPLSGGGGPGYGGWGLNQGTPRGTSPSRSDISRIISARRVLSEEYQIIEKDYEEQYAPQLSKLPETVGALKLQISTEASNSPDPLSQAIAQQKILTSRITQIRDGYLQIVPNANAYYGALAFYKRADSMMSRLLEPGVFTERDEAFARAFSSRLQRSWEGAYKLHIEAHKHQALADDLSAVAAQVDGAELSHPPVDLIKAAERRTTQIIAERQIYFNCLPNVLQHELSQQTTIDSSWTLAQTLNAYLATATRMVQAKQSQIPTFKQKNPQINAPLSKPQLEALLHLVDEQRLRRAGPRWKEYHQALALSESIRFLGAYSSSTQNLVRRANEVEQLRAQHASQLEVERQKAEAERLAAEEAARQAAEAKRLAAEAERHRQEVARRSISYINDTHSVASATTVIPIGAASFAVEVASVALRATIVAAVSRLAAPSATLAVAILSAAWPSTLGNAERRYLISTPLSSLSPPGGPDLAALALSSASVDVPYLLAGSEEGNDIGLYVVPGGKAVAVRAATFDTERQVYSLVLENPQRILTWTPASPPGGGEGSSTSLPPAPPGTIVYTGSSLNPVSNETEGYPALDLLDQERLIITFPIDSGLPPILVVFKSPRYEPGTVTGVGAQVTGIWLGEAAREGGAPIPAHIADQLRGIEFPSYDAFREKLWKIVANDPELSKQFSKQNLSRMRERGNAPRSRYSDAYGKKKSFELHHVVPISEGGAVYDIDNLRVVTPAAHHRIHYGDKP